MNPAREENILEQNHDLTGIAALRRLANAIIHKQDAQAAAVHRFLMSVYNGFAVRLSTISILDMTLRQDFAQVLMAANTGVFHSDLIRDEFIEAGDQDPAWFVSDLTFCKIDETGSPIKDDPSSNMPVPPSATGLQKRENVSAPIGEAP